MELDLRRITMELAKRYGIKPQHDAGQNFLVSSETLQNIVHTAAVQPDDTVLEIGPGFGTLTVELCQRAKRVIAVELDQRLFGVLGKLARVNKNLTVVRGDVFQQREAWEQYCADGAYQLVANIPYSMTSKVLRDFTEQAPRPRTMTLLVQREVAERVVARPGKMSVLSVAVQFYGRPTMVSVVPRTDFWPEPEVDSALLRVSDIGADRHGFSRYRGQLTERQFFSIVKIGFQARRKQLHNNLSAGLGKPDAYISQLLEQCGVDPSIRPQSVSIEQWMKIAHNVISSQA